MEKVRNISIDDNTYALDENITITLINKVYKRMMRQQYNLNDLLPAQT